MNSWTLLQTEHGAYTMQFSLYLGPALKSRRMKLGLGTKDRVEAHDRAVIVLRLLTKLGVYKGEVPALEKGPREG